MIPTRLYAYKYAKKKIKKKNLKNITKGVPIPGSVILIESKGAPRV